MTGAHSYTRTVMAILRVNADNAELNPGTGPNAASRGAHFTERAHKRAICWLQRHGLCEYERSDERFGDLRVWYARLTEKGRMHEWGRKQL